jgi:hypothetical protein
VTVREAGLRSLRCGWLNSLHIGLFPYTEAAQSDLYYNYLKEAEGVKNAVHIIYINTALDTKVRASEYCLPRHLTHLGHSFLESNGFLGQGEQYIRGP